MTDDMPVAGTSWSIFWVSVLGLFLELMLIRWIGTEVRIFAYLQNTVLVVCFLGLGMGCWTSRQPVRVADLFLFLLVLTTLLSVPFAKVVVVSVSDLLGVLGQQLMWNAGVTAYPPLTVLAAFFGLLGTFCLMCLVWRVFVPIGRVLGRLLEGHPRTIWAYSLNIMGSLVGIWLFVLVSALHQPPVTWLLVSAALIALVFGGSLLRNRMQLVVLVCAVGVSLLGGYEPGATTVVWSPYQKLVLSRHGGSASPDYTITVNNTGYQLLLDLSDARVESHPDNFPVAMRGLSQYDVPLLLKPQPDRMLIVGAGGGNDVAGGLRHGARSITAVEIDPAIASLGSGYHPEAPYDAPNVRLIVDDARSFFARSHDRFDLIVFSLLDSHTTTAMTNARLDHFVYTRESIAMAKALLREGGVMTLSFEAWKPYIADRIARTLREVFGEDPLVFRIPGSASGWGGVMFVAGDMVRVAAAIEGNGRLAAQIAEWQKLLPDPPASLTAITTDDWPYLYLDRPHIPILFVLLAGLLLVLFLAGSKQLGTLHFLRGWDVSHWHFFFLGSAFLLLETQNISRAAAVFGNTWWVNAIMISGILLMILFANLFAALSPHFPRSLVFLLLIGTCLGLYFFVDIRAFSSFPFLSRAVAVGGMLSMPILFSGIVFIQSFAHVRRKDLALGANLLGALVGGILQSVTFMVGMKALLLIVAGLYVGALFTSCLFHRACDP